MPVSRARRIARPSLLAFVVVATACRDRAPAAPELPDISVSLGVHEAAIPVGFEFGLDAHVNRGAVRWTSSDAVVASVSKTGVVRGIAVGTAMIRARSAIDTTKSDSAIIDVAPPFDRVRSVAIEPRSFIMAPNQSLQLVARVARLPGVSGDVVWSVSDTALARISPAGFLMVSNCSAGTATISAAAVANTQVSSTASLTVRVPQIARISIQKITTGNPPDPVNLNHVTGTIEVTVNVGGDECSPRPSRIVGALIRDGVVYAASEVLGPAVEPEYWTAVLRIETDARDSAGRSQIPNGAYTLRLSKIGWDGKTGSAVSTTLILVNP
jgi:hypothetical protein